jgi:hypothetical protein
MKTFYQFLTEETTKDIDSILNKIAKKTVEIAGDRLIEKIPLIVKYYNEIKNNNISGNFINHIFYILPRIKDNPNAGVIDFKSENIKRILVAPYTKKYTNSYKGFQVNLKFDISIPLTKDHKQVVNKGPAMMCSDHFSGSIKLLAEISQDVYDKIYKLMSDENSELFIQPIPYVLVKNENSHYIAWGLFNYKAIDFENAKPIKFLSNLDFYDYYSITAPLRGEPVYNFEIVDAIQANNIHLTQNDTSITKFLKNLTDMPDINEIFTRELCSKLTEYKDIDKKIIRNAIKDILLNLYRELGAD